MKNITVVKCSGFTKEKLVEHFEKKIEKLVALSVEKHNELNSLKLALSYKEEEKVKMKGKREEHLNDIWRDMKVEQEKYFAGEALTWKTINK